MTDDSPPNFGRPTFASVSGRQHLSLSIAAALIGVVTAVGVRLFTQAIAFIQSATRSLEAASALTIPLTLALGGVLVAIFLHRFGQKTELIAVPHIIDAVASKRIQLHRRNGLVYVLASAWSIGIGAPVGADTPAAMIGGHLGFTLGKGLRQRDLFIRVLVAAGVAAGIASTFFAQLAAVFFAFEVVLGGFGGAVYVVPILIAVAASSVATFYMGGTPPQFAIGVGSAPWTGGLAPYLLGVTLLATLAAIIFVNLLPWFRRFWAHSRLPYWAKTGLAGLVVGIVAIWRPEIMIPSVTEMQRIFAGANASVGALLALAIAKLILTPWSLGAGFAGGAIGPTMAIGAALGAAFGHIVHVLFPGVGVAPEAWAVVAVAAMLAATFHAPLFGAMMMYEMVSDYRMLAPLLFASAIAYGVAMRFQPGSAFTLWLSTTSSVAQAQERPAPE